ncbi:MAG: D-alanyl-D-alanine carboxypeptidase [Rhodospirillaceae bacterium]
MPIRSITLAAACAGALFAATPAGAVDYSSIVIDADSGKVLQADRPDARNYPASLTKMMTLYLAFEALDSKRLRLDQELTVSAHAEAQRPSKLGLRTGETIKAEHAILAVVTKSANDMAVVLAEALGGSEAAFAVQMTQKARGLGMTRTTFRNASGLPNDQQMSTPRDLATLGLALIEDWPQFYHYFSRTSFSYNGQTMANHNHLMSRYPGMDGIKTGFINKSGFNLVASAVRNGHRLVAVVMGGPSARARDNHMAGLLDAAFRRIGSGKEPAPAMVRAPPGDETADASPEPADDIGKLAGSAVGDQDDDQDPAPQPPAKVVKVSAPPPNPAHVLTPPRTAGSGNWSIQLGRFVDQAKARAALDKASRHLPSGVGRPAVSLQKVGDRRHKAFRALLTGFRDERSASLACAKIKIRGHVCRVMPAAQG